MSTPSSPSSAEKRLHALKHSRTLNSLADSIRSLRDSTGLESKSGPASPVISTPSTPKSGGQFFSSTRQRPSTPQEQSNSSPTTNRIDGKYSPRPLLFSTMSSEDLSWSPKARFQAFMAPNNTEKPSQQPTLLPIKTGASPLQSPQYLNKRTISSPILQTTTATSHDIFPPTPMRSTDEIQLPIARPMLNSNLSSPLEARPATSDSRYPTSVHFTTGEDKDAASMIAKAGSAEAVIEQLLRERQAAATRSEQLWQLVEKQRAMILGLNKDLEVALQDKEKYWKRLKDQSIPPKTSENEQSPRESSELQQPESQSHGGSSKSLPKGLTRLATTSETSTLPSQPLNLPLTPESAESTDKHTQMSPPRSLNKFGSAMQRTFGQQPSSPKMRRSESDLSLAPSIEATPPKPVIDSAIISVEKFRKAPPKPLNLSSISVITKAPVVDSDSEYSEIEESDQSSQDERGRRATREDDDRQREVLVMKEEEERRSRSGKSKTVKNKPIPAEKQVNVPNELPMISYRGVDLPARVNHAVGLPSSPRAPLLGGLQSPLHPSLSSIGSILKPGERPIPQRIITAPLMSPGLPATPRPIDRPSNPPQPRMPVKAVKSMVSLSSPEIGMSLPLSPSVPQHFAAPRLNVNLPLSSPLIQVEAYNKLAIVPPSMVASIQPVDSVLKSTNHAASSALKSKPDGLIYQGFASEKYPNLLLPPNALPVIDVRVQSCRLMPSRPGRSIKEAEEELPFTLGVYSRANGRQLWIVEKTLLALNMMDQSLKSSSVFNVKVPERSLFNGQSPAKIDARRFALNSYFKVLLDTAMDEKIAMTICGFFSTDVRPPVSLDPVKSPTIANEPSRRRKEGYLSKKGKSFGGWKARYFVTAGAEVQYYETLGGDVSGTINLRDAQIARQTSTGADDAEYRHAFMILELKRKDSSNIIRHILCAETDEERDEWIEVLLPYTDLQESEEIAINVVDPAPNGSSAHSKGASELKNSQVASIQRVPLLQTVSYDSTLAAELPQFGGSSARASWSPTSTDNASDSSSIAGRSNQAQMPPSQVTPAKASPTIAKKKRSMWFRTRPTDENVPLPPQLPIRNTAVVTAPAQRETSTRGVFGIPLAEAAEYHSPVGIDVTLPAPIYRCIEYLEQKQAAKEEGIFRLSGSSSVVKAIKERFNSEGDIKLLDGQHYDVHAVASVLKLYLRELPESVLTRKLHLDFLRIIDAQEDHRQKVIGVNILVHKLPEANHEILATLSRFLIDIVNNSDVNKMTVRNVGIVFSPTLNIPAPLISLFLTDYGAIFGSSDDLAPSPLIQDLTNGSSAPIAINSVGMDSIRSPRKQLFTDLPTPSFAQHGFGSFMQTPLLFTNEQAKILRDQASPPLQDARTAYDTTGFMPLKQAYNNPGLTNGTALRLSAISSAIR